MPDALPSTAIDRPRGILSERDRKYLLGQLGIEPQTQRERSVRQKIRQRVWNGLLDFMLISEHMDERDQQQVFHPQPDDDTPGITEMRDIALKNLTTLLYRHAADDDARRLEAFSELVEYAVSVVDGAQPNRTDGERIVTLQYPNVTISIDYPRRVNLDRLEETLAAQPDNLNQWDWSGFSLDELLFLLWYTNDVDDDVSTFDLKLVSVIRTRLTELWPFDQPIADDDDLQDEQVGALDDILNSVAESQDRSDE